jgi:hypothetical protein
MSPTMLFDFMYVLNSLKKHPIKDAYFFMHILFSTRYLLLKQKLNPNNSYEQEINMIYFIQANGYDINMHANIQCINMYEIL